MLQTFAKLPNFTYLKQHFYEYFVLVPQCKGASISLEHTTKSYIMQNFTFSAFGKTKLLFKYYIILPTALYMCFIGLCPSQHWCCQIFKSLPIWWMYNCNLFTLFCISLSFDNAESLFIGILAIWKSKRMKRGSTLVSKEVASINLRLFIDYWS